MPTESEQHNARVLLRSLRAEAGRAADEWSDGQLAAWGFDQGVLNRTKLDMIAKGLGTTGFDICGTIYAPPRSSFRLHNDPPKRKTVRPENVSTRQRPLFSGLDCLPGQGDLFPTDGEGSADE